ncbi:MAG: helix-turn-helix transcriptional regulator [Kiritimatiellae bacterium]|nr:helix-turn-helix transcriptional regulator [Kiritimatiellia bacterium]
MNTPQFVRYEGGFDFAAALQKARENPAYWQEDILLDVAHRLSQELDDRDMTQADLASKLGVKPGYISRVLRGHENLTLQTLAKIAFALGKRWECMLVDQGAHIALFTCSVSNGMDPAKAIHHAETATISVASNEDYNDDTSAYGKETHYAVISA